MKKMLTTGLLLFLAGCTLIEVGDFGEKREAMHEQRNYDVCDDNPDRCIKGTDIPW